MPQGSPMFLGYFCRKIGCQELSKIAESGHTVSMVSFTHSLHTLSHILSLQWTQNLLIRKFGFETESKLLILQVFALPLPILSWQESKNCEMSQMYFFVKHFFPQKFAFALKSHSHYGRLSVVKRLFINCKEIFLLLKWPSLPCI